MTTRTQEQIAAIHAMMHTGHRSVRMEWHTLVLWGLAAAGLILGVRELFTPAHFPVNWQRVLAAHVFIALVVSVVGVWDYRWTRRARAQRDETLSFVQRQLIKVWWLMVALVVLINLGMNFFGGGYLFYAIMMALMGIAFYVHGLFSAQMLSWAGLGMVGLGLGSILVGLPFPLLEWLTVSVFGLGWPLLALLLYWEQRARSEVEDAATDGFDLARLQPGNQQRGWWQNGPRRLRRPALLLLWLGVITVPVAAQGYRAQHSGAPAQPVITLAQYQTMSHPPAAVIVQLPAGTVVPVKVAARGALLRGEGRANLPLVLAQPLSISVRDGHPDGRFRIGNGPWQDSRYSYRIRDFKLDALLEPATGPEVRLQFRISTDTRRGH